VPIARIGARANAGEVAVWPPTVTLIFPVVAPEGTTAVSQVAEAAVTWAEEPLNFTASFCATASKLVPVMVTAVPAGPADGLNPVMVGTGV
jgi:hypothetical protein